MRAVVQRVRRASVTVDGETVGEVGPGLLVLVGISHDDTEREARALVDKLLGLRIFSDDEGRMNRSVVDSGGGVLVVSQFTLLADARKGRRPSFADAAPPEIAAPLVDTLCDMLGGRFGAMMDVELVNDGPVTLVLDVAGGRVH